MAYRKYGNKKVVINGITFDSKREASRYQELRLLLRAGLISDLELQKEFVLIPEQREASTEVFKRGKNAGLPKQGKLIEKPCVYKADFVYKERGEIVVEDTKGVRTKDYIIKRKLMLYIHGLRIREV